MSNETSIRKVQHVVMSSPRNELFNRQAQKATKCLLNYCNRIKLTTANFIHAFRDWLEKYFLVVCMLNGSLTDMQLSILVYTSGQYSNNCNFLISMFSFISHFLNQNAIALEQTSKSDFLFRSRHATHMQTLPQTKLRHFNDHNKNKIKIIGDYKKHLINTLSWYY